MWSSSSTVVLALLALPSLTSALTIHNSAWARPRTSSPQELFARDSTCGDPAYVQCGADLPSDFCCPAASTCMALAGHTTALCCPTGGDCSQIEAIPCDVSLEDKSKYPSATVMTSALTGTLETCGEKCCPFGYACGADGTCNLKDDQSEKPSTSSAAASSTAASSTESASATATETAGVSPTTSASSSATSTSAASTVTPTADRSSSSSSAASTGDAAAAAPEEEGASPTNAGLVAGGVIGGIAGVVFLGLIILFCIKRERRRKALSENHDSEAATSIGTSPPQISQPIVSDMGTFRSDFTRKASQRTYEDNENRFSGGATGGGMRHHEDPDDFHVETHDDASFVEELADDDDDEAYDDVSSMHDTARSPPRIITPAGQLQPPPTTIHGNPRAVSSMYGSFYDPGNDPGRQSEYQAPLKMPSARAYGGNDARLSVASGPHNNWLGDPLRDSYYASGTMASPRAGGSGLTDGTSSANGYINVFADSNALAPPPLEVGEREKRETRFSDFGR